MIRREVIEKAIAAHADWKGRLRSAVSSGKFDVPVSTVRMDNCCDFGKWLYGNDISPADASSERYGKVKQMHAEFHKLAAAVVEKAISGQSEAAANAIAPGSSYAILSSTLISELVKWRDTAQ